MNVVGSRNISIYDPNSFPSLQSHDRFPPVTSTSSQTLTSTPTILRVLHQWSKHFSTAPNFLTYSTYIPAVDFIQQQYPLNMYCTAGPLHSVYVPIIRTYVQTYVCTCVHKYNSDTFSIAMYPISLQQKMHHKEEKEEKGEVRLPLLQITDCRRTSRSLQSQWKSVLYSKIPQTINTLNWLSIILQ